jgi:hypothetical protein
MQHVYGTNYHVLLAIGIVVFLIFVWFVAQQRRHSMERQQWIPKNVYTFWVSDNPKESSFVLMCIKTWYKHLPDWQIHVITEKNLGHYAPESMALRDQLKNGEKRVLQCIQKFSDLVRLEVLATHGGVWLDASVFMTSSLNWIHTKQRKHRCTLLGYLNPIREHTQVMENWFIACTPAHPFVLYWRLEYIKSFKNTIKYLEDIPAYILPLVENPSYLTMNVCWKYVFDHFPTDHNSIHLMSSAKGPFSLQVQSKWNPSVFVHLFHNEPIRTKTRPFIKITAKERKLLLSI